MTDDVKIQPKKGGDPKGAPDSKDGGKSASNGKSHDDVQVPPEGADEVTAEPKVEGDKKVASKGDDDLKAAPKGENSEEDARNGDEHVQVSSNGEDAEQKAPNGEQHAETAVPERDDDCKSASKEENDASVERDGKDNDKDASDGEEMIRAAPEGKDVPLPETFPEIREAPPGEDVPLPTFPGSLDGEKQDSLPEGSRDSPRPRHNPIPLKAEPYTLCEESRKRCLRLLEKKSTMVQSLLQEISATLCNCLDRKAEVAQVSMYLSGPSMLFVRLYGVQLDDICSCFDVDFSVEVRREIFITYLHPEAKPIFERSMKEDS